LKVHNAMIIGGLAAAFLALGVSDAAAGPIGALVVAAVGLTGTAATIGASLLNVGLAVGLSALSQKMRKKKSSGLGGANLSMLIETDAPRQFLPGRYATAGSLAYWQCTGTNNQTLHMVIALADHECDALESLWVDGKERAWNSGTGVVDGFDGKLKVRFYRGTGSQTVDTAVRDASGGRWTNNEVGHYVCYAVVEATQDEKVFKGGIPQIVFVVRGARLYDPRYDTTVGGSGSQRWNDPTTWVWTDNPAVVIYNVLRSISPGGVYLMGLNAPADTIRMAEFEAAANACDELVSLAAGGTEKRYRCGFAVAVAPGLNPEREALDYAMAAMAGDVICSGGIYRIMAGVARTSVATLSDEDFIVTEPLTSDPRRPRSELTNAIAASFSDPSRSYAVVPLPTRRSSADETADGGYQWTRALDLSGVLSRTQGQRVQEIRRREARRQLRAQGALRARWFTLEPGDWVTINSTRRGWSSRTFQVGASRWRDNLVSSREFIEADGEIDDWLTSDEIADNQVADLPGGGPTLTAVSGWSVAIETMLGTSGQQTPGIIANWTPITDYTVVQIEIEYRKTGDTVALKKIVLDPSESTLAWTEGVQSGVVYQVRARPVTVPTRQVDWTAWTSTDAAPTQIVAVAQLAEDVTPGIIDANDLDAQTRFLLLLAAAVEELQGGVGERLSILRDELQVLGSALLVNQIEAQGNTAAVRIEQQIRQSLSESFASYKVATDAVLLDPVTGLPAVATAQSILTSRVTATENGIDAIEARATIAVNVNNQVVGVIDLAGNLLESVITLLSDKLLVAKPDGTGATNIVTVGTTPLGASRVAISGDVLVLGSILASHLSVASLDAIVANIGTITAGRLQRADGTMVVDLDNKEIMISV
jgi:hypothetical protein